MDANTLVTLLIAGTVIAVVAHDQVKKRLRPAQHAPTLETFTAQPDRPIATRAWLDYVNAQPDRVPHLAIIGPSGAGKTTAATAVLADRPGRVVVITAKEGDSWGGLPYVGIDADATYTTARRTFDALSAEVKARLVATKERRFTGDWLTIVVDDFSTLKNECPTAAEVVKLVARLGRALRVRLVMLSDSALVKAIGLEGEGETRSNFAFVRLARGHKGTIEIDGSELPIDTTMLDRLAKRADLRSRSWRERRDPDDELRDQLGLSDDRGSNWPASDQTDAQTDRQTVQTRPSERILLRRYYEAGLTREQARRLLQAEGLGLDNNDWAKLGEQPTYTQPTAN